MFRIREVKSEIRVLGISVKKALDGKYLIIGVIFRGKLHIDGILRTISKNHNLTSNIIKMIQSSSHVHQLRVLLLDLSLLDPEIKLDLYEISKEVAMPVIALGINDRTFEKRENAFIINLKCMGGYSMLSIGLCPKKTKKILEITSKIGLEPEALRIAEIIALSIIESIQHNL